MQWKSILSPYLSNIRQQLLISNFNNLSFKYEKYMVLNILMYSLYKRPNIFVLKTYHLWLSSSRSKAIEQANIVNSGCDLHRTSSCINKGSIFTAKYSLNPTTKLKKEQPAETTIWMSSFPAKDSIALHSEDSVCLQQIH